MKATYAIYDEDGRITAILSGPTVSKLPPENAIEVTEADVTVTSHYVSNGILTEYPEKPSGAYVFNFSAELWELDLNLAKDLKWAEIKRSRASEEFGSFIWGTYTFQCDEVSQRRIQGAVQLAAIDPNFTVDWTLLDNSVITLTSAQMIEVGQTLASHVNALHVKARGLRSDIDAATTEAEISAITW